MNNQNERSAESETSTNKPIPIIRYCLYARKSMEDEERQALSIDSQLKEMKQIAERDNLCIVAIRTESHSAKSSGMRPVFNKIIEEIKAKKYNAILTWNPDRLSRNAGDLGCLVDLMDNQLLIEIRTYNQKFINSPNEKFP
jgi:DNA invertase Pin-like site-specific DNA recombinase